MQANNFAARNRKMARRGKRNNNPPYNNHGMYQQQRTGSMPIQWQNNAVPPPQWQNSNTQGQIKEMELELEVVKRKRQMLHEQRQLLEEQRQLQQLQAQIPDTWNDSREYGQTAQNYNQVYGNSVPIEPRVTKRPANFEPPGPAPQSGGTPGPKNKRRRMAPHADGQAVDVGSPQAGDAVVFGGVEGASRSVLGKLELCLGRVVRETKDAYSVPPHGIVLQHQQERALKERVRERIHDLMLNKPVTGPDVIYKLYRATHPLSGDLQMLQSIRARRSNRDTPSAPAAPAAQGSADSPSSADKTYKARRQPKSDRPPLTREQEEMFRETRKRIHRMLEDKLDVVFNKLHKICMDEAGPLEVSAAAEAGAEQPAETADTTETNREKAAEVKVEGEAVTLKPEPSAEVNEQPKEAVDEKAAFVENLMDRFLRMKIPSMIPRYKHHMISILSRDKQFRDLGLNATDKLPELPKSQVYSKIYYVKICGRPSLPPRGLMRPFLDEFGCVSVKKHKNIFNLLFVGVATEENQKKLLESDGAKVGNKKLEIKISEGKKDNAQPAAENDSAHDATIVIGEITDLTGNDEAEVKPTLEQATVAPEEAVKTEVKAEGQPDDQKQQEGPAAGICTRSSSRVIQKN